jgi:hypothetical protein
MGHAIHRRRAAVEAVLSEDLACRLRQLGFIPSIRRSPANGVVAINGCRRISPARPRRDSLPSRRRGRNRHRERRFKRQSDLRASVP